MTTRWLPRPARAALVGPLLAALVGCTVHLVSDYDDQIDAGLSELNTDATAFVNKMIANAGQPAGTYDANKDFYTTEYAKVDTLILRAEAIKALDKCPSTEVVTAALTKFTPPATASSPIPLPDLSQALANIPKNDCSVVLLGLIKQGFTQLESLHRAQGALGIPKEAHDPILVGGLGSLIHTAIVVELALKSAAGGGGQHGT